ncbi:hypothetical protein JW948_01580 [bacterium]|nr:hypothetical protein [bacterium]
MNLLLIFARIYVPVFIRKKKLKELFELTADAFQCEPPALKNLSCEHLLEAYADFSSTKAAEIAGLHERREAVKTHLYRNACRMGEKLRREFRIRSVGDMMHLGRILYRILGIEFSGNTSGEVTISRCFFSRFYTPDICGIISSLDRGVMAGLSGGGRLTFRERITEGNDCCLATFHTEEPEP